jgi:hypothetical protein
VRGKGRLRVARMTRRLVAGVIIALIAGAAYVALLYIFFTRIWPLLPVWANIIIVIALAISFVASPMALLLRLGRTPQGRR